MKRFLLCFLAVTVFFSVLSPLVSAEGKNAAESMYEDGLKAFEARKYDTAFAYFQISGSVRGYAPALNMLGVFYRDGLYVEKNEEEAIRYFKLASEQGDADAAANLAAMENPVVTSEAETEEKYQKAVDLFFKGEYAEAEPLFRALGEYKHSAEFLKAIEDATEHEHVWSEATYSTPKTCSVCGATEGEPLPKPVPVITSLELNEKGSPVLSWKEVPDAEEYYVYRSERAASGYIRVSNVKKTSASISNCKVGKTYYFKVQAKLPGGVKSEESQVKSILVLDPLTVTPDLVIWDYAEDDVASVCSESTLKIETLTDDQVYAPRLNVKNNTNAAITPEITATVNGEEFTWEAVAVEPGENLGFVCSGAYDGAGSYYYTFYLDGKYISSGSFTVAVQATPKPAPTPTPKPAPAVDSYYVIGTSENTFDGLYRRMCVYLDLKKHPVPTPDENGARYGTGDYERIKVLKDDDETYEVIGYIYSQAGKIKYIYRSWTGMHRDGVLIAMDVYYDAEGRYIGNIRRDLDHNLSNSSSSAPYYIPSEGTHNLK